MSFKNKRRFRIQYFIKELQPHLPRYGAAEVAYAHQPNTMHKARLHLYIRGIDEALHPPHSLHSRFSLRPAGGLHASIFQRGTARDEGAKQ